MHLSTIELQKANMKFSAGHFTIFSETEREALHGHNYTVHVSLTTEITGHGLNYDYRYYKRRIAELCQSLHQTVLMPEQSPYLEITELADTQQIKIQFNQDQFILPQDDVTLLPIRNITVEELSHWFIQNLVDADNAADNKNKDKSSILDDHGIHKIVVKVYNGPGQSGSAQWQAAGAKSIANSAVASAVEA